MNTWIFSPFYPITPLHMLTLHLETEVREKGGRERRKAAKTAPLLFGGEEGECLPHPQYTRQWISFWTTQTKGCKPTHVPTAQEPPEQAQPRSLCCTHKLYYKIKVEPRMNSGPEAQGFRRTPFPMAHQDMISLCGPAVQNAKNHTTAQFWVPCWGVAQGHRGWWGGGRTAPSTEQAPSFISNPQNHEGTLLPSVAGLSLLLVSHVQRGR